MKKDNPLFPATDHKILLGSFAILIGIIIFSVIRIFALSSQVTALSKHVATIDTQIASTTLNVLNVASTTDDNFKKHAASISAIEQKVGLYQSQVSSVSSTVSTLQKLSKTDPQLLAKYSKVFFLNENYAPERLAEIYDPYKYSSTKAVSIHADVWPQLQKMMDAAKNDGISLFVTSGYRSFAEQKNLKSDYKVTYGAGTANQFSAEQGYSEHQLGTTIDFTTTGLGGELDGFEKTKAYTWLKANAYRFGFILSYPENNQFYIFEPWHWRFVGLRLAADLNGLNKNFYEVDQRTIDTYLASVF